jgi:hypothetical protein
VVYLEDFYQTISWDETLRYFTLEARGFVPDEKTKAGMEQLLEFFQQQGASKLLLDLKQTAPFSKDLEVWLIQSWYPRMIAAGLKNLALVLPQNALARLHLDKAVAKKPLPNLETELFEKLAPAIKWLSTR